MLRGQDAWFQSRSATDVAHTLGEFSDLPRFWYLVCAAAKLIPDSLEHGGKGKLGWKTSEEPALKYQVIVFYELGERKGSPSSFTRTISDRFIVRLKTLTWIE